MSIFSEQKHLSSVASLFTERQKVVSWNFDLSAVYLPLTQTASSGHLFPFTPIHAGPGPFSVTAWGPCTQIFLRPNIGTWLNWKESETALSFVLHKALVSTHASPPTVRTHASGVAEDSYWPRSRSSQSSRTARSEEDRDGLWDAWGPWSECSRTCGGGASYSLRRCLSSK